MQTKRKVKLPLTEGNNPFSRHGWMVHCRPSLSSLGQHRPKTDARQKNSVFESRVVLGPKAFKQ